MSCRSRDLNRIRAYLAEMPPGTTLGAIADALNRGVRYVHSLIREDGGREIALDTDASRVGSYWAKHMTFAATKPVEVHINTHGCTEPLCDETTAAIADAARKLHAHFAQGGAAK